MKIFFVPILCFCCFLISGCHSDGLDRVPVEGSVSFDGNPVEQGYITFKPQPGTSCPVVAGPIKDGKYRIAKKDGPVVGAYYVGIVASVPTGRTLKAPMTGEESPEMKQIIPDKYTGIMGNSALTATIEKNKNVIDFELQTDE